MPEHAAMLATYQRLHPVRHRVNMTLVKTLDKKALDEGGRRLGMLRGKTLVFGTEDEMSVLMDYCIYHYRTGGRNAVERSMERTPPAPGSDDRVVLDAMLQSHYSLFQVVDVTRGVGVTVLDLLRDETGFLVDIGLGSSAVEDMVLATRVIPFEGFLTTGGAGLPIDLPAMKVIGREIDRVFGAAVKDVSRFTPDQEDDLAALVIRLGLKAGVSSRIEYRDPDKPPAALTGTPRVGRNERCPCGSGKKYKVCCGGNQR